MARISLILPAFCFLALHLNPFVIEGKEMNVCSSASSDDSSKYYFWIMETSKDRNIARCQFFHKGIKRTMNVNVSNVANENRLTLERRVNDDNTVSCLSYKRDATIDDYGRYEIKGYSSNGKLLTSDIVHLYKEYYMKSDEIDGYNGEYVTISLTTSDILEVCNNETNMGFCPSAITIAEPELKCTLHRKENGKAIYYGDNTSVPNSVKRTGTCQFKIYINTINDWDFYRHLQNYWRITAWYGKLAIKRGFMINDTFKKLEANVGSNLTLRVDSPENKDITCLSCKVEQLRFQKKVIKQGDERCVKKNSQSRRYCEYILNNVSLKDDAPWFIEYVYDDDNSHRFRKPYNVSVIATGKGKN